MPFTFEPLHVTSSGNETVLRGRVVAGAYFGPEAAVVRSTQGRELATHIHSHLLEYPAGWPVVPEHDKTLLVLSIPALPPDFELASLQGVGAVVENEARLDVSALLHEPRFWAIQLAQHGTRAEVDDPGAAWLGIDSKSARAWYHDEIDVHVKANVWPYLRVPLPRARYIELELAFGAEYQDRIWIGDDTGCRALLGYHSGHSSLPALAVDEVAKLAAATEFAASNLLWLAAAYAAEQRELVPLAERLASKVPGLREGTEKAVARSLVQRLTVPHVSWRRDPTWGTINDGASSQRNPQSRSSVLSPDDFSFIARFFAP